MHNAQLALSAPSGWTTSASSPASFQTVAPDQTVTTTWKVTVPPGTKPDAYQLTGTATYQAPHGGGSQSADSATVTVPYASVPAAFNNVGITDDADHSPGNFDGSGNSYSAQALAAVGITPGATITKGGVAFTWPNVPAGTPDNVAMQGQLISVSGSGSTLGVLGSAVGSTQGGTVTVRYTDGSTQDFTLTFPDWFSNTPVAGDDLVATTAHLNRTNNKAPHTVSLFAAYVPLTPGKTVQDVQLPNAATMHAFDLAIG